MGKTKLSSVTTAMVLLVASLLSVGGCRSGYDLQSARGQMAWGVDAANMNLWREARFRFERAVQIDPGDARTWSNLAVAYEGTGEYELAREAYLRALQLDRSNEYIQRNYSRFIEHHDTPSEDATDEGEESPETRENAGGTGEEEESP